MFIFKGSIKHCKIKSILLKKEKKSLIRYINSQKIALVHIINKENFIFDYTFML